MALSRIIPSLLGSDSDWWDSWDYPSRILDQHFGSGLHDCDLHPPTLVRGYLLRPRTQANLAASGESVVSNDKESFQVKLNVNQFQPEELDVKMVDNCVVIHGKHEEKSDEHGFVSREFTRKYVLPNGVEPENVKSSLSKDGVLTIAAPKKMIEPKKPNERVVPIAMV